MKTLNYLKFALLLLLTLAGCSRQKQFGPLDLTSFYQKADLSTEQIYQRLMEKNRPNQMVSLFIRCSECTPAHQDSLTALAVQINSLNDKIVTARVPASAIPAVAELGFVTAIENARAGKLK